MSSSLVSLIICRLKGLMMKVKIIVKTLLHILYNIFDNYPKYCLNPSNILKTAGSASLYSISLKESFPPLPSFLLKQKFSRQIIKMYEIFFCIFYFPETGGVMSTSRVIFFPFGFECIVVSIEIFAFGSETESFLWKISEIK